MPTIASASRNSVSPSRADRVALTDFFNWRWSDRSTRRLLAIAVFALTAAVFLPVIYNTLINWDDEDYFVTNTHYRGLAWSNIRWCFTTYHMGHYQPLNWLSYAVDYSISGMKNLHVRLHQTQSIIHGINAAIVMLAAYLILKRIRPAGPDSLAALGGAAAALFFSLHPLRVESVAWSSARSDLIATPFYVLAVIAYLQSHRNHELANRPWLKRLGPVLLLYILALLGKEFAVTLPAILLVLDVYPLERMPRGAIRSWFDGDHRHVWLEKLPFFIVAAITIVNAFAAAGAIALPSMASHPIGSRIAQIAVSLVWYPYKTLVPTGLTPLYEFPVGFGPTHPLVIRSVIALAIASIGLYLLRRRMPGLIAAAICYLIIILPVSGLTQRGPQITADRYSYLAFLPWAVAFGFAFQAALLKNKWITTIAVTALFTVMGVATQKQISVWRDSYTLWTHGVAVDDSCGGAHAHLGHALHWAGKYQDAIREYHRGLELGWENPNVHRNLAAIYNRLYKNDEAIQEYLKDIKLYPGKWESHYYLGVTYERQGKDELAREQYMKALELNPDWVDGHVAMGRLLMEHGFAEYAEARFRHALSLQPGHREAMERLAILCADSGRLSEALDLIDKSIAAAEEVGDASAVDGLRARRADYAKRATSRPSS